MQRQYPNGHTCVLRRRAAWFSLAAAATAALPAGAGAATATWTGGSGTTSNWSDPANWGGTAPVSGADSVVFDGAVQTTNSNDFLNATLKGITFAPTAGAFTLGGNTLNLAFQPTGVGITNSSDVVNNSANDQTLNLGLALQIGKHAFTTTTNALNLHAPVTRVTGSTMVFSTTGGAINTTGSGLANDASGILGGWASIGAHWATVDGSGNIVPYSAYTNVTPASGIVDGPTTNVRIPANTTAISFTPTAPSTTVSINTLMFGDGTTSSTAVQTVNVGAANTVVLGQNGGIFNSTGAAGTARALTFGASTAAGGILTAGDGVNPANITLGSNPIPPASTTIMTINSSIQNNGTAPVSVTLMGGYIALAGTSNNYTGGTYILSGRVSQPANSFVFGRDPSDPLNKGGRIYILPHGQINPGGGVAVTLNNDMFIAGNGTGENNGLGAIRMFQTSANPAVLTQLTGTISLLDHASISSNGNTVGNVGVVGKITGTGNLNIGSPSSNANANGSGLIFIGPQTGTSTAANDYTGDTIINGTAGGTVGSTLRIGSSTNHNLMPHGATGGVGGAPTGNLILNATAGRKAVFDLNGSTQTINGLSSTATSPAENTVSSTASGGVLIVGDNDAIATYGGNLVNGAGTLALTKIGAGTQTLAGTHTYTGPTTVNGGTLALTATWDTTSPIVLNTGGTLRVNTGGDKTLKVSSLTIAGGRLDVTDNDLIVDYTGASVEGQVRQWVKDGRVPSSTSGIFSTPGSPDDDKVVAIADNAAWGKSSFNGISIDTDTVVGKYTYFGDANLDGKVTGDDYVAVDANLGTGDSWLEGDFNMNGVTTGDDYVAIDANLGKGTPTPLAFAELKEEMVAAHVAMFGEEYLTLLAAAEAEGFGASVVPEPAAVSLLGLGAAGLLGRRRRRA